MADAKSIESAELNNNNGSERNMSRGATEIYVRGLKLKDTEGHSGYAKGGYHPVHLGDEFQDGRYRVLHKLGFGGFSTVWLARDLTAMKLVALKVMVAEASNTKEPNEKRIWDHIKQQNTMHPARNNLCMLLDNFVVSGPNGTHSCLVHPVTGLGLGRLFNANVRLRGSVVRNASRQLTQALAFLHSNGICHGDLTASNLTLRLLEFEHWTDAEVKERLGEPNIEHLRTISGDSLPDRYPRYIVQPVDMYRIDPQYQTQELVLIDFNEAFFRDNPPKELGTPAPYRSPSLWFGEPPGIDSELWALGCTIFCLRHGRDLVYDPMVSMGAFNSVETIIYYLGPLPDRWDRLYFNLAGMAKSRDTIDSKVRSKYEEVEAEDRLQPWERKVPAQTLRQQALKFVDDYHGPPRPKDIAAAESRPDWKPQDAHVRFPAAEAAAFGDIVERLLCYEYEDGISATSLIDHPWLQESFPDNTPAADARPLFQSNWPPFESYGTF